MQTMQTNAPEVGPTPEPQRETITLTDGLRINRAERWVELDGFVPINVREQDRTGYTLIRYLECIAVTPVSGKDHESLMVTRVRPSTIHAALLTLGLEPGSPAAIFWDGQAAQRTPASGSHVEVFLRESGAVGPGTPIAEFITHADTGVAFDATALGESPRWVFAGSLVQNDLYVGDDEGLVVGLHTFGSEVVALQTPISPDSYIEEPRWIAHPERTPPFGTQVVLRILAN